jgi:hypothetical protein
MPALHADIPVSTTSWVAISNGPVGTFVRVQNVGGFAVDVQATVAAAAPSGADPVAGALRLSSTLEGDIIDVASRFPGVGTSVHLWARAQGGPTKLSVSHA